VPLADPQIPIVIKVLLAEQAALIPLLLQLQCHLLSSPLTGLVGTPDKQRLGEVDKSETNVPLFADPHIPFIALLAEHVTLSDPLEHVHVQPTVTIELTAEAVPALHKFVGAEEKVF
jgi:hypothetical protein